MSDFEINFLDHVAIRVKDINKSAQWYQDVFGLKMYRLEKWGDYPIFLLAGKSGLALFPASREDPAINKDSNLVKIDHFAFNVTNENFIKARSRLNKLQIDYSFQDHHYFHSIYIKDPDGHTVELTTLMVKESEFYQLNNDHENLCSTNSPVHR